MRLIDGDALEKEGWSLHRTVRVDMHASEYQIKPIAKVPTIDPVRKGRKINQHSYPAKWLCSECGAKHFDFSDKFCSECGVNVEEGK